MKPGNLQKHIREPPGTSSGAQGCPKPLGGTHPPWERHYKHANKHSIGNQDKNTGVSPLRSSCGKMVKNTLNKNSVHLQTLPCIPASPKHQQNSMPLTSKSKCCSLRKRLGNRNLDVSIPSSGLQPRCTFLFVDQCAVFSTTSTVC